MIQVGDRVLIISAISKYRRLNATVARVNIGANNYVGVYPDSVQYYHPSRYYGENDKYLKLCPKSVQKIDDYKEDFLMNEITGYNKVAAINMGSQTYYFALFDNDVKSGDKVIVSGTASGQVWTVKDVITKEEAERLYKGAIRAEVMCKVDSSEYDARVARRKEAATLKAEMNKKVKELQDVALFELMAEKSPELKEMLERYKVLSA